MVGQQLFLLDGLLVQHRTGTVKSMTVRLQLRTFSATSSTKNEHARSKMIPVTHLAHIQDTILA
jgi:hypothetical protein